MFYHNVTSTFDGMIHVRIMLGGSCFHTGGRRAWNRRHVEPSIYTGYLLGFTGATHDIDRDFAASRGCHDTTPSKDRPLRTGDEISSKNLSLPQQNSDLKNDK